MTKDSAPISSGGYSHDLLLHDRDDDLVDGIRAFVDQGLASGGHVIVHGTESRVAMLRNALGSHPRLEYGLDRDLYVSPSSTLFAYQRKLAESPEPLELWATGTVPVGDDNTARAAWARYESLVNEALGAYAFHGLCTYDTRTLPAPVIAAAKTTHPCLSTGPHRTASRDYQQPAEFLSNPMAGVPGPPDASPAVTATLHSFQDLQLVRHLVGRSAASSAVAGETIHDLITAVNEILVNGLEHGGAPVHLTLWVEPSILTCQVVDAGPGIRDLLAGYRYPEPSGPKGMWVARQLCEEVFVSNLPSGGCRVLLVST